MLKLFLQCTHYQDVTQQVTLKKKSKSSWFAMSDDVITALTELGTGDKPTEQVIKGCEKYMCNLF